MLTSEYCLTSFDVFVVSFLMFNEVKYEILLVTLV